MTPRLRKSRCAGYQAASVQVKRSARATRDHVDRRIAQLQRVRRGQHWSQNIMQDGLFWTKLL